MTGHTRRWAQMYTSLSDAFHFLVGVLWCSGLISVTIHGDTGPQSLQGYVCSSLVLLWNSVISEVYLLWQDLAVSQSPLRSESPQAESVSFCEYVCMCFSGVFRCFPKSSFSVSLHVPRSIFSMCLPAPLASSCHSSLSRSTMCTSG